MHYEYKTQGTCSRLIKYDLDEQGQIHNLVFIGGCSGNLKAISKLVEGMHKDKIIEILKGNTCSNKPTSCADQLARALEANS